jgi:hypothetical protein
MILAVVGIILYIVDWLGYLRGVYNFWDTINKTPLDEYL